MSPLTGNREPANPTPVVLKKCFTRRWLLKTPNGDFLDVAVRLLHAIGNGVRVIRLPTGIRIPPGESGIKIIIRASRFQAGSIRIGTAICGINLTGARLRVAVQLSVLPLSNEKTVLLLLRPGFA
jgi:hypothetical protein